MLNTLWVALEDTSIYIIHMPNTTQKEWKLLSGKLSFFILKLLKKHKNVISLYGENISETFQDFISSSGNTI